MTCNFILSLLHVCRLKIVVYVRFQIQFVAGTKERKDEKILLKRKENKAREIYEAKKKRIAKCC